MPAQPSQSPATRSGPPMLDSELERRAAEVRREKAERARFTAKQKAEASALRGDGACRDCSQMCSRDHRRRPGTSRAAALSRSSCGRA
jgi:hypothetical protein